MKKIIITIDNEEDNQWDITSKQTTENANYLERFQNLCNKYGFKPTYLTTYHMAQNPVFIELAKRELQYGRCEVGMHLHAWSTPPMYNLQKKNNNREYLIEYPNQIMEEKFIILNDLLNKQFGEIVSHRSGRWATDDRVFDLLNKYGYKCDCSVTPNVNWSKNLGATEKGGSDYSRHPNIPYMIGNVLEVPMTVIKIRSFNKKNIKSIKSFLHEILYFIIGRPLWFRPSISSKDQMMKIIDKVRKSDSEYIMFMIHSSELMPGGSPYFTNSISIDTLYNELDEVFEYAKKYFEGITLKDYVKYVKNKHSKNNDNND